MIIKKINAGDQEYITGCAILLVECFEHSWNTLDEALEEMKQLFMEQGAVFAAIEGDKVVGFIGGHAAYHPYGWELHPLAVSKSCQRHGLGTKLVKVLEEEISLRGGNVIFLGADDENGATTLSNCDLFTNTYEQIKNIKNLKNHPFEFYQKNGYQIVGVLPDVNGYGKPDIHMAKRIMPK